MTLEQVNHHERAGVLPLAFSCSHFIKIGDGAVSERFLDEGRPASPAPPFLEELGTSVFAPA